MKRFLDFRKGMLNEDETQQSPQPQQTTQQPQQTQQQTQAPQQQAPASDPRAALAAKIKPQTETAKAVIDGIYNAFKNNCGGAVKYDVMGKSIRDSEEQIRGACQMVISAVNQANFDWHNWDLCSPKSYDCITKFADRDFDALKLCAAVIIFYNSLVGAN